MHSQNLQNCNIALYVRKSSEQEDRQIESIDSQIEYLSEFAAKQNLYIKKIFKDSASAHKVNNRSGFNALIKEIKKGTIDAILCWKADRLARNMIEGGTVIYLLQNASLKAIITPYSRYHPTDNTLPLTFEMGMANQFSIDLSRNVKRGNKTKTEKGGFCNLAPAGYLNDRINKTIIKDEQRFPLIQKMFQMYSSQTYSIPQICAIANKEWGFRTRRTKNAGGKKLHPSMLHRILKNPFYYGLVRSGSIQAMGTHEPMISKRTFDKIAKILTKSERNTCTHKEFLYTGAMSCYECGSSITAEEKTRYNCPKCNKKHCSRHPKTCSCGFHLTQKIINKGRHYTYYRCTKRKKRPDGIRCSQPCLRAEQLEFQIEEFLKKIELPPSFVCWAKKTLELYCSHFNEKQDTVLQSFQKKLDNLKTQQTNLTQMRMNAEIDSDEFKTLKNELVSSQEQVHSQIEKLSIHTWKKEMIQSLNFMENIHKRFKNLPKRKKKQLFLKIGSNPKIWNRKLHIDWNKTFEGLVALEASKMYTLELEKSLLPTGLTGFVSEEFSTWWTAWDKLRSISNQEQGD